MTTTDRLLGAALLFIIALAIGGVVFAVEFKGRSDISGAQRDACRLQVKERLDTIEVRTAQEAAARGIANDLFQSKKTRAARGKEAKVLRKTLKELKRSVDPENGGTLDCNLEFPSPSLTP